MEKHITQIFLGIIGGIAYILGGFDSILVTLITFMIMDYITGVLKAIRLKQLNSQIGAKGIVKKIGYLVIVVIAVKLDSMLGNINYIRNLVIFGFISNEGISILENATLLEIPIPDKVKSVLKQLKNTESENTEMPKKND